MKTYLHDELTNGDPVVENGAFVIVEDGDAVVEMIRRRVRIFKGEWFLDIDRGPDWRNNILVKNPDPSIVAAELKTAIADVPGFIRFHSFALTIGSDRVLTVTFEAMFDSGPIKFNEVFQ